MTVFLDSNIILDILLKNADFYEESKKVLELSDSKTIDFYVSAASITDIFYILNKRLMLFIIKNENLMADEKGCNSMLYIEESSFI